MSTKIESNYNQTYTGIRRKQQKLSPQFTGASTYAERITAKLPHAKTIEKMKKLEWLKGEIGGILITAFGTGLVAPIFIGYNPFVKAPKNATKEQIKENNDTKLYTAMRQPISAVLAILFQASVQKYIDKGLDVVFNNPEISKYTRLNLDQQEINTTTFIKSNVKKQMAEEGLTKPSKLKAIFSKDAKELRKSYIQEFDSRVENKKAEQISNVAKKFQQNGKIMIGERHLDFKTTSELINKQIDEYIKDAKKLQKTPEAIAKYLDRGETLTKNQDYLKEIFKDINANNVTEKVQSLLSKETNPEIKTLLQEILDRPEDLRLSRINRTLKRIDIINNMCSGKFTRDSYRAALLDRNKVLADRIVELTAAKVKDPKTAAQSIIKKSINKIAKHCNFAETDALTNSVLCDTDTFDKDLGKLTKKIYKDITKGYKKLVENNYKSWNQFTKIGVGVFITLPITCTALNWVYPRFMDIFFPGLAGKKDAPKKIGGNK